jgi:hypothetical protein
MRIAGVPAEIPKMHLPSTSLELYLWTNLFATIRYQMYV